MSFVIGAATRRTGIPEDVVSVGSSEPVVTAGDDDTEADSVGCATFGNGSVPEIEQPPIKDTPMRSDSIDAALCRRLFRSSLITVFSEGFENAPGKNFFIFLHKSQVMCFYKNIITLFESDFPATPCITDEICASIRFSPSFRQKSTFRSGTRPRL